jgi:hypothetical protein|nr:hypothetical protein [uncultured bacterium]|tara:strand:- start:205 stop:582 length:378 start_codon:yes stop_codon:yes gene_type:complete
MTAQKMNLINALTLILLGLWGYIDVSNYKLATIVSFEHWTALITVLFGIILLLCNKGIQNSNKAIAHVAVVLTLLVLIALVGKRLPISIDQGGVGLFRVLAMSLSSFIAFIAFIRSFIENRKKAL